MSRLDAMYLEHGQSPWIDNIRRDWLVDGTLQALVDRGVRGVTSNPSIFAKSLATSTLYDEAVTASDATDPEELFEELAVADVRDACDVLAAIYEASRREFTSGVRRFHDGFVSLEVSPLLAHDATATIAAASRLAEKVGRPNVMIKIPATLEGLDAIRATIGAGISVNVTLIFSLQRYEAVITAYLAGLGDAREAGRDLSAIASVASFFVSRVDSATDPLLNEYPLWQGTTANTQIATAYQHYVDRFAASDAENLLAAGAQVQRPLWASTSTKNPAYDDLLYVEALIADETVNTMPEVTLEAFAQRGGFEVPSINEAATRAPMVRNFEKICAAIDMGEVTTRLEVEGVAAFESSYLELLDTVRAKLARH